MKRQINEHDDEYEKEMNTIKAHLDKQDKQIETMTKKMDEVLILLGGSLIGKTKGLVEVVDQISNSLEDMIGKFEHAEKWRTDFKAAQVDNDMRNQKKREISEQREFESQQKDKEIAALKKSSTIKNWVAAAAVIGSIIKLIIDHYR
jgi:hypothetical protein